jgi:hypothetical protein
LPPLAGPFFAAGLIVNIVPSQSLTLEPRTPLLVLPSLARTA